jgi:hypothetical protein
LNLLKFWIYSNILYMDNIEQTDKPCNYKDIYNLIIQRYREIDKYIRNIQNDIKKLDDVHHKYINTDGLDSLNYSTYVDDIKYQLSVVNKEYKFLYDIFQSNLNKLYRDLFKLYSTICKTVISIYKDNKDVVFKIWNSTDKVVEETVNYKKMKKIIRNISESTRISGLTNEIKIFNEIKKYYFSNIKIFNELHIDINYDFTDIDNIYNELDKRICELHLSNELIKININDLKLKTDKGILGQTLLIDLDGRINKIDVEYKIIINILSSIINIHVKITEKYKNISTIIADSVVYDEDSIDNVKILLDDK